MNKIIKVGQVALLAFASAIASAQWNVVQAGPFVTDGPIGFASNGYFNATYTGPSTVFGNISFKGDLTSGDVGSYLSEARWSITNLNSGASGIYQPSGDASTWLGTFPFDQSANALFWIANGDNFKFESYESFNDSGVDATWTNVEYHFSAAPTITNIGTFASGTDFVFDTEGTTDSVEPSPDTELALYKEDGTFLLTDDDGGTDYLSRIAGGLLPDGNYLLVVGGYNSNFATALATPGEAAFDGTNVNVNGTSVFTGVNAPFTFNVLKFTVGAAAGSITGNIVLQDWNPGPAGRTVSMEFYSGFTLMGTGTATLDALGNYSITSPVADGTYKVIVDGGRDWLRRKINTVVVAGGAATNVNASCLNGNIVDDTVIDLSDYTALIVAFNTAGGREDVNGDGIVDLTDYTVVVTNFNAIEDTP